MRLIEVSIVIKLIFKKINEARVKLINDRITIKHFKGEFLGLELTKNWKQA